ncbi:transposase [Rhodococcus erythropolis]|uniref:transposase n=1 Tax=Rhodococcus erythropolis TaxID=1833 RepID=UPI0037F8610F
MVTKLAAEITAIDHELADLDSQITERFTRHESAEFLLSLPGFGPVLAATFLANIGDNPDGFDTVDRLSLPSPVWRRSHGTPDGSAATFIGPGVSTADCSEPVISLHCRV